MKSFFASSLFMLFSLSASSQYWSDVGGGMNDWVNASVVYKGSLVVAGKFTAAGGVSASRIASWDGNSWSPLGSGVNGEVKCLAVFNNYLVVGGSFTSAGGLDTKFIALWDGTQWLDNLGGMNHIVAALTVYNNQLIAGGYFTQADNLTASCIASWTDATGWKTLGTGMGGSQAQVMSLTVWGTKLIAGGFFTSSGGSTTNHIAQWDGSSWSSLGTGIDNIVYSLCEFRGSLVAGGLFSSAGGVAASSVAAWDGTSWSSFGTGLGGFPSGYKYALCLGVYHDQLFAGGIYQSAGVLTVNAIAKWDGASWSDLNGGLSFGGATMFAANSMTVYADQLFVGGMFTGAGGTSASHLASWFEPIASLPLNFTQFKASLKKEEVQLDWVTENESGLSKFILERAVPGQSFVQIGVLIPKFVSGSVTHCYHWEDRSPLPMAIYRVAAMDWDGDISYSPQQAVKFLKRKIKLQSTMVHQELLLEGCESNTRMQVSLLDNRGAIISNHTLSGSGQLKLPLGNLQKGWHTISYRTAGEVGLLRFFKL